MRAALLLVATLAACDPIWSANVRLRDPTGQPIVDATVAVVCPDGRFGFARRTTGPDGTAMVGSLGTQFPPQCDVYIAKPGFATQHIRYADLCPAGPEHCEQRVFWFDLLVPYE